MKFNIPNWLKHLLIVGIFVFIFYPTARNYLFSGKPAGGDLSNAITYLEHFRKDTSLPPSSWQPFWFSGVATFRSYPWLHFYLMAPLSKIIGSYWTIEIYSLTTLFLFYLFSYFLFYRLSKNYLFGLLATLILFYSREISMALFNNGFIAAVDTQFFLPLSLLLLLNFTDSGNKKYLLVLALSVGISILGHPMVGLFFVFVPCLIFLLLRKNENYSFKKGIGIVLGFILKVVFLSAVIIYPMVELFLLTAKSRGCTNCNWNVQHLISFFNPWFFIILVALFVVGIPILLIKKDKNKLNLLWIFITIFIFLSFIFISLTFNLNLIPLIGSTMWPERIIWAIILVGLSVSSVLMSHIFEVMKEKKTVNIALHLIVTGLAVLLFLINPRELFTSLYAPPGIFPHEAALTLGKYEKLDPKTLVPSWLDTNDFNHRYDDLIYEVNHWWNSVFAIPNTRGYAQYTKGITQDWYAWYWAAETSLLKIEDKGVAKNNALYLLDWFGVSYFEQSPVFKAPDRDKYADYMFGPDIVGKKEDVSSLTFYKLRPEVSSPIISATNAPSVLIVGGRTSYDDITRALGNSNLNSRQIIPVIGPAKLEDLTKYNLKDFDLLYLVGYQEGETSQVWNVINDYVKNGGKVFIDTGVEVRETQSTNLPDLFPVSQTQRDSLGMEWKLTSPNGNLLDGVEVAKFAPLNYQGSPWKLSYIPDFNMVKKEAKVLLVQDGKPIMVEDSIGQGKVIWTGLNLAYHAKNFNNSEEGKLIKNLLSYLAGEINTVTSQEVMRPKAEKVTIEGSNFKGVLFKEVFDSGWKAKAKVDTGRWENLPIYQVGPDFMYARLPKESAKTSVEFNFRGSFIAWILFLLSILTLVYSIWSLFINKKPDIKINFLSNLSKKVIGWWNRDEE